MKTENYEGRTWITCEDVAEWRHERAKSVGASAVPALFGLSKFQTARALAERMRAELNGVFDNTQNLAMRRGHAYEGGVARLFAEDSGLKIVEGSEADILVRRDDMPFMHASPDRLIEDEDGETYVLECKTTQRRIDADNIPTAWVLQLQIQLGVLGYKAGYLAWDCLVPGGEFGYKRFEFDEEMFKQASDVASYFYEHCVVKGEEAVAMPADAVSMYPKAVAGLIKELDTEGLEHLNAYKYYAEKAEELQEIAETYKAKLKLIMGDAETLTHDGEVVATWRNKAGAKTFDSKRFKAEHPDMYEDFIKQNAPSRVFFIK